MATINMKGQPIQTSGELPDIGDLAPDFTLAGTDLSDIKRDDFIGKKLLISTFPSLDTGVCAASVRRFNQEATSLDGTVVLNVSMDLPFAHSRFCAAEGIDQVTNASAFRSRFGTDYGITIADAPMAGLLARSVIVLDEEGKVSYVQLVSEMSHEPDYEQALAALQ
ncbi:thiol peroxidase [Auritidibacter ignavus]|uniref:Thiol peroxidase n=1 Tax=Auritidibacter ignavus TaxID=678932 RepID=A0AAJ6AND9_9MICC|nr:thiol peroxidase [Auritidibacter ignavus]WGH93236.1 thiol peroxidase [Auritidibacter ignavus]